MNQYGSFNEIMERDREVTDYTSNGKCTNCGACCNDVIPLTNSDINRIKNYVRKKKY